MQTRWSAGKDRGKEWTTDTEECGSSGRARRVTRRNKSVIVHTRRMELGKATDCNCDFHMQLRKQWSRQAEQQLQHDQQATHPSDKQRREGKQEKTLSVEEAELVSRARATAAFAKRSDRLRARREWVNRAHAANSAAYATLECEGFDELELEEAFDGVAKLGKDVRGLDFERALECCKRATSSVHELVDVLGLDESGFGLTVDDTNPERFLRDCAEGNEALAAARLADAADSVYQLEGLDLYQWGGHLHLPPIGTHQQRYGTLRSSNCLACGALTSLACSQCNNVAFCISCIEHEPGAGSHVQAPKSWLQHCTLCMKRGLQPAQRCMLCVARRQCSNCGQRASNTSSENQTHRYELEMVLQRIREHFINSNPPPEPGLLSKPDVNDVAANAAQMSDKEYVEEALQAIEDDSSSKSKRNKKRAGRRRRKQQQQQQQQQQQHGEPEPEAYSHEVRQDKIHMSAAENGSRTERESMKAEQSETADGKQFRLHDEHQGMHDYNVEGLQASNAPSSRTAREDGVDHLAQRRSERISQDSFYNLATSSVEAKARTRVREDADALGEAHEEASSANECNRQSTEVDEQGSFSILREVYGIDSDDESTDTAGASSTQSGAPAGKLDDEDETACVICWQAAVDTVIKPCNHAVSCAICALTRGILECPMCRERVIRVLTLSPVG